MYKQILIGVDGSDHAVKAANTAINLAQLTQDAYIHAIYVVDGKTSKQDVLHYFNSGNLADMRMAKIEGAIKKAKELGIGYKISLIRGKEPGVALVEYAQNHQIDLIVVGKRGLNSLQEMVLGSVSQQVVKRAKCSVLIVK
jgi:nucleotide-binding universal stress UspA family protein